MRRAGNEVSPRARRADRVGKLAEPRVVSQRTDTGRWGGPRERNHAGAGVCCGRFHVHPPTLQETAMAGPGSTSGAEPAGAASPVSALRSPMLAQLMPDMDRIEPRTRVAVSGLPESKLRELPPDGGWNIAQVFEHLCRANLDYLDGPLPGAIAKARARGRSEKPWRPSLTGGWLAGALIEGTKPLPTVKPWRVSGEPR